MDAKKPTSVTVSVVSDRLRVRLNDTLHLSINLTELVGIQSWKYGNYRYAIEYTLKTTSIETWYTQIEIWQAVLAGLEAISLV